MKKHYVFAPGPVSVPPEVLLAGAQPTMHHRSADFPPFFESVQKKLKQVFRTENPVVTLASSGTASVEAAMVSTTSPGDTVLVYNGGKFGERWCKVAKAYQLNLVELKEEWGNPLSPESLKAALAKHPETKAVVVTQTETSTGTLSDIKTLAGIVKETPAILIVDAVSAFVAEELETDAWGVDMVCTGSQKALMLPPGIGLVSVSPKAQKLMETSKMPKLYLDLKAYLKVLPKNDVPYTPPVNLIYSLDKALDLILGDGVEEVWARHGVLAKAQRAAMRALDLQLFSKSPSVVTTMVLLPEGVEYKAFNKQLKARGITIAGGQDHMEGKAFRIATLGYYDLFDTVTIVTAVELALHGAGYTKKPLGTGVQAALDVLKHWAPETGWRAANEKVR